MTWGGATILCTRNVKFELIDHKDCAGQGLTVGRLRHRRARGPLRNEAAVQVIAVSSAQSYQKRMQSSATQSDRPRSCAASLRSKPGCSTSTTRSIRITCSGSRSTTASGQYVSEFLRVTKDEAFKLQKDYYKRYGTTMRGMMTEHGIKPDELPGVRAPDRPFAAGAEPGARRRDREACRAAS